MNDISSISGAQVKDIGYKVASEIRLLRSRTSELELELQKAEEKVLHLTTELTETRRLANETKEDLEESKIRYNSLLATVADLQVVLLIKLMKNPKRVDLRRNFGKLHDYMRRKTKP